MRIRAQNWSIRYVGVQAEVARFSNHPVGAGLAASHGQSSGAALEGQSQGFDLSSDGAMAMLEQYRPQGQPAHGPQQTRHSLRHCLD